MTRRIVVALFFCTCLFNFSAGAQQLKGDPWIFKIYKALYNRQPNVWELNSNNYNLGIWNSYEELRSFVDQYHKSLSNFSIKIKTTTVGDKSLVILYDGSKSIAANLVSNDGGMVLAVGGANIQLTIPDITSDARWNINGLVAGGAAGFHSLAGIIHADARKPHASGPRVIKTSGVGVFLIK